MTVSNYTSVKIQNFCITNLHSIIVFKFNMTSFFVVSTKAQCVESFLPCSCYQSPLDDTIEISCYGKTVQTIQDLFNNRTSSSDIDSLILYGIVPNEMDQYENLTIISLPADWFGNTRVGKISIQSDYPDIPGLGLTIHQDAFRASKEFARWFQIGDFVFVGNTNWIALDRLLDFSFLTGFTQLDTLVVMDSPDFRRFNNLPMLPKLKSVIVNWCPSFKQWDGQVDNTGLESINLDYNYMDDATIESIINAVALTTSARTLRSLSFVGLDSEVDRPSRIPKAIASSFPNLNSLDITYNQIRLIESGSLAFASTQQILKLDK